MIRQVSQRQNQDEKPYLLTPNHSASLPGLWVDLFAFQGQRRKQLFLSAQTRVKTTLCDVRCCLFSWENKTMHQKEALTSQSSIALRAHFGAQMRGFQPYLSCTHLLMYSLCSNRRGKKVIFSQVIFLFAGSLIEVTIDSVVEGHTKLQ